MQIRLLIRADASPQMGTGHIMRCLALAQAAQALHIPVQIVGRIGVLWLRERLKKEGVDFIELPGSVPPLEKPEDILAQLPQQPSIDQCWVVLDGYHFGLDCQNALRAAGYKLLVIDDYAHLSEYSCDILLNQNLGSEDLVYSGDNIGIQLRGTKYALLRQEFLLARQEINSERHTTKQHNILITLGGGDFFPVLQEIATCFAHLKTADCLVRIVAGSMNRDAIAQLFEKTSVQYEILTNVEDMPGLLLDTSMCITAGGSTCWELCCLGVPFLVLSIADNQEKLIKSLILSGFTKKFTNNVFLELLNSESQKDIQEKLLCLIDGAGAYRVLANIVFNPLVFREALPGDADKVLHLANLPSVLATTFSNREIELQEHMNWYEKRLNKVNEPFLLLFSDQELAGYLRIERDVRDRAVLSIALAEAWRGKSIGPSLITFGVLFARLKGISKLLAKVKSDNYPSQRAFQKAGFIGLEQGTYDDKNMLVLCKEVYRNGVKPESSV